MIGRVVERFRVVPMIMVMGTIFFLSHQPGNVLDLGGIPGIDKVAHVCAYGLLGGTVILAFGKRGCERLQYKVPPAVIFACLFYGLTDEFHQAFIPGRFVSAGDIVADIIGGAISVGVWLVWRKMRKNEVQTKAGPESS